MSIFFGVKTLDFDEGGVVVLVAEGALVVEVDALDVQAGGLGGLLLGHFYLRN